jgi:hypothetical protein
MGTTAKSLTKRVFPEIRDPLRQLQLNVPVSG